MAKRKPFDVNSPEAAALRNEIVQGTFVKEGTLVAFPLCFPGDSALPPADECHITALDVAHNWMVYGGTSGRQAHLFVGMFHGATGMVFDMGTVDGATECAAICCGEKRFVAFANGPDGGRAIARNLQGVPFDLLQEWGMSRQPYADLGQPAPGERVLHAVADASRSTVVGVAERHLFTVDIESGEMATVAELPGRARLAVGNEGGIYGRGEGDTLWRFDVGSGKTERRAVALPQGAWQRDSLLWARGSDSGLLYTADGDGQLFSFREAEGFEGPLATVGYLPVGPMAVTRDGRLFGTCGEGIERLFGYDPRTGEVADLGCAVSVIERRRYGYVFGDAAVGRDGQLYFGENDDLGHLWIYFPSIPAAR